MPCRDRSTVSAIEASLRGELDRFSLPYIHSLLTLSKLIRCNKCSHLAGSKLWWEDSLNIRT